MIVLQIQLTPKQGQEKALEEAVRQRFMPAMSSQPGFVEGFVASPLSEEALAVVGAQRPPYAFQVTARWSSEEERRAWVARDIHQEAFGEVRDLCDKAEALLFETVQSWPG